MQNSITLFQKKEEEERRGKRAAVTPPAVATPNPTRGRKGDEGESAIATPANLGILKRNSAAILHLAETNESLWKYAHGGSGTACAERHP